MVKFLYLIELTKFEVIAFSSRECNSEKIKYVCKKVEIGKSSHMIPKFSSSLKISITFKIFQPNGGN